ncbi:MAG: FHA domain-containing protein [Anaerolineaceae bacterium]|nr:FHA domain-containing protein [Anaerolineaceae bacterium]
MTDSLLEPIAKLCLPIIEGISPCDENSCPGNRIYLYPGQKIRLGRAPENDVVLDDPMISREHALIEWNGNGFLLSDLGSINGTYVNTTRLMSAARQLRDGDEISLSRHMLLYELLRDDARGVNLPVEEAASQMVEAKGPRLIVSAGPDMGQEFPLWGEVIIIGRTSREATWEIRLTDRSVSRPHARLERSENACTLSDLESANGTLINNSPVTNPVLIQAGDVITLGETSLVYCP